jgi:outer membrane receptor protein involved in Fe transport
MLQRKYRARRRAIWLVGCSVALVAGVTPTSAAAQSATDTVAEEQAESEDQGSDIVVTGSRIDRPGFESPTPLTQISAAELSVASRANVGAALADLPQFKAGQSPQTSGTNAQAGRFPVDLRGLGAVRTLVLLDGRRFSSDNDLSTIPNVLVKKIDIVTGGASAAWGSGAVAGVVNISLDDKLTGLRLGAEGGVSTYGDGAQYRLEGAFGVNFAGDRGHFMIGGEYLTNDGIVPKTSRPNTGRWVLLSNGNGTSTLTPDVGYANAFVGGIITSGVLRNSGFNPDGTLRALNLGTANGTNMVGGEAPSDDDLSPLSPPQDRVSALARVSYDIFDNATITADVRYSRYWGDYIWFGDHNRGNLTIRSDNAFLRPEIRDRLAAAGQTSFTMGRFNSDFAYSTIDVEREAIQGTIALDGQLADGRLRYSAYYSHGEAQNNIDTPGFRLTTNFNNAVDSIISPTTGQPICRIALTNPSTDCVPINLFGNGAPSAAAAAYVTGTPQLRATTKLDTAAVSLRGEPFDLWAGPVSVAVGGEWRRESITQRTGALDQASAFTTFRFAELFGTVTVKEAFAEASIPLAKDLPVLRNLNLNAAARISDYSTSGSIWSWKVGLTNEFVPGVIGRVTRSRDIRAPTLSELYSNQTISFVDVSDPVKQTTVRTLVNGGGFAGLTPEKADTWTAGFTASPLRRLTASIDYFDIAINNVITTISAQNIVSRCFSGNQDLCARVFRDADGNLTRIVSASVNLAEYKTNGIDAEIGYVLPLSSDKQRNLNFRVLGTWVNSLTTYDGVSSVQFLNNTSYAFVLGMPEWRVNGSIGYSDPHFNGLVRLRYISPGFYDRNLVITNNRVPAYTYVDLQLGAKIPTSGGPEMEIYANVSNLFDKDPPIGSLFSPFYDTVGRFITVGARVKF